MAQTQLSFPTQELLMAGLTHVLGGNGSGNGSLTLLDRKPVLPGMTFPVEIVTCRWDNKQNLKLFCKYESGRNHDAHGHRGGVSYEAEVYRELLQGLPARTAKFYGTFQSKGGRELWLILGLLERGRLLRDVHLDVEGRPQPTELGLAARWIGQFHALTADRLAQGPLRFLNRYDANYYRGWVERTRRFARELRPKYPWLDSLGRHAEALLAPLKAAPHVVIHGEYYQNNIIVCGRRIYPTDWESAALAPGEIDLAALTEGKGWHPKLVQQCLKEYKRARWPKGAPANFESTLEAARIYLHFRWLGERSEWTTRPSARWRFEELRGSAEKLGLIQARESKP